MNRLVGATGGRTHETTPSFVDRTNTEEVEPMSTTDSGPGRGSVKTLAIRLEPELHAQLSLIAQLRASTITDEIRAALEAHIAAVKATPELAAKAGGVLENIEREAAQRRDAIATLFGSPEPAVLEAAEPPTPSSRSRGRKAGSEEASDS